MSAKILVVDDEPQVERLILQRFRKKIKDNTYQFDFASNGKQALEVIKEKPNFDVILCDINMPEMDGITLLSKLNELDLKLRTVMVSAYGDMPNIRATMNLGAFDFVMKPIDFKDLEATITKTLKEVETLRQAAQVPELQEENAYLSQLDALKTKLFTNISHELRTPLTIIKGMTEQIQERPEKWLSKGLQMIKRNSLNLLNLVNQILDLRKLEMGKIELNLVQDDIIPFLSYLLESFHSLAEQKDIQLTYQSDQAELWMDYDPEKILRIISNLISNAIKYTPVGGQVSLRVSNGPNELTIQVIDNGVGIAPEALPNIFDRFYQVGQLEAAASEGIGVGNALGTGIGLTIVKEFVQLLGGTIEVSSKIDDGTIFTIKFPIRQNAPKAQKDQKNYKESDALLFKDSGEQQLILTNAGLDELPKLLIVEDNPDVLQYLVACLEDRYHLEIATNGQAGVDKAIEMIPDIIISDVMMPEKNGYELCEMIKTDQRTSHIPVVLLTAKADEDSKISGLKKGADAYLVKPFNKEELLIRLNNLVDLRLQLQEKYRNFDNSKEEPSLESEFLNRIKDEIYSNLDDEHFGINELCRNIGMSRAQLHRKLKALTGVSTSIYIRSIRLHKAQSILLNSELNISQVAFEVGFSDPKYFSRTFTEEFGMTPKAFRQERQG